MTITVEDIFKKLSFGVLSNLSMSELDGVGGSGQIAVNKQGELINYLNDGLLRLYSRFILSEKQVIFQMRAGITSYYFLKRFAQSNMANTNDPRYILDALNPFQEDVIKPLEVFDSLGRRVSLNDQDDPWSVFTPSPIMLQVPHVIDTQALSVSYQAKHPKLEYGVLSANIELPEVLHEPLVKFVAYSVYSAMNTDVSTQKAQEHLASYESLCKDAEGKDLVNASISNTGTKFNERGFV